MLHVFFIIHDASASEFPSHGERKNHVDANFLTNLSTNLHIFFRVQIFYLRLNLESIAGTNRHFIDRIITSSKYGLYLIHFDYNRVNSITTVFYHLFLLLYVFFLLMFRQLLLRDYPSNLIGHFFFFFFALQVSFCGVKTILKKHATYATKYFIRRLIERSTRDYRLISPRAERDRP